jgi:hypothetical protein
MGILLCTMLGSGMYHYVNYDRPDALLVPQFRTLAGILDRLMAVVAVTLVAGTLMCGPWGWAPAPAAYEPLVYIPAG